MIKEVYVMLLVIGILLLLSPIIVAVVIALVRKFTSDYTSNYGKITDSEQKWIDQDRLRNNLDRRGRK